MKPSDTNDERNDPVWELLNSTRKIEASPVFVQNTVRQARQLGADRPSSGFVWSGFFNLLRRPAYALPLAAAAIVTVAMIINTSSPQSTVDGGVAVNGAASSNDQGANHPSLVEAPLAVNAAAATTEFSFTDQVEKIDTLGDLVVITDPSSLNEQLLADLFY